jgi:hypothetical protein
MNQLALLVDDERTAFRPGETVRGRALWVFAEAPDAVEVRLFWHTEGKGDTDVGVVDLARFDEVGPAGDERFALRLRDRPWSYAGTLISVIWSLEIVALPSEETFRLDLQVGAGA